MSRKIKIITVDGDGCLFSYRNIGSAHQSSWDALGFAYGLKDVWDERAKRFYKPGVSDREWARLDIKDLEGREASAAYKVLHPIPYSLGARDFFHGSYGRYIRGIVSTAIDLTARTAARELRMEFCACNDIHILNGVFTGTLSHNVPLWEKHKQLKRIYERYNVCPGEICHLGDNDNDIQFGQEVGLFVAVNPKTKKTAAAAKHNIQDFRELNKILKNI